MLKEQHKSNNQSLVQIYFLFTYEIKINDLPKFVLFYLLIIIIIIIILVLIFYITTDV